MLLLFAVIHDHMIMISYSYSMHSMTAKMHVHVCIHNNCIHAYRVSIIPRAVPCSHTQCLIWICDVIIGSDLILLRHSSLKSRGWPAPIIPRLSALSYCVLDYRWIWPTPWLEHSFGDPPVLPEVRAGAASAFLL